MDYNCGIYRIIKPIYRFFKLIYKEIKLLPQLIYSICFAKSKNKIIVSAWCKYKPFFFIRKDPIIHNNWGDDINYYFLKLLTGKDIIIYPNTKLSSLIAINRYMCIGSILNTHSLSNTTIFGTGILNENQKDNFKGLPKNVFFVRGPLSSKCLKDHKIDNPEIYGDLALLLPLVYKQKSVSHWKIGIVPHYDDMKTSLISEIMSQNELDIHIIKMRNYSLWTDIIDEICSCDIILSSSLHGLIVAETYGIPNVWIYLSDYVDGWGFKFYDFYSSINKKNITPVHINTLDDIYNTYTKKNDWKKGQIEYNKLYDILKEQNFVKNS